MASLTTSLSLVEGPSPQGHQNTVFLGGCNVGRDAIRVANRVRSLLQIVPEDFSKVDPRDMSRLIGVVSWLVTGIFRKHGGYIGVRLDPSVHLGKELSEILDSVVAYFPLAGNIDEYVGYMPIEMDHQKVMHIYHSHSIAGCDSEVEVVQFAIQTIVDRLVDRFHALYAYNEVNQINFDLRRLSLTDQLTGISDRHGLTHFLGLIQNSITKKEENDPYTLGMIMFDIDHFKKINDTQGHDVGDKVLQEVVQRILNTYERHLTISKGDYLYDIPGFHQQASLFRLSGDEFAILVLNKSAQELGELAEVIRNAVAENPIKYNDKGDEVTVTLSMGVADIQFSSTANFNERMLMKKADMALYVAKESGRDTVRLHNPEMIEEPPASSVGDRRLHTRG